MAAIHSGLAVTTQLRWEGGPRPSPSTALHRAPELAWGLLAWGLLAWGLSSLLSRWSGAFFMLYSKKERKTALTSGLPCRWQKHSQNMLRLPSNAS